MLSPSSSLNSEAVIMHLVREGQWREAIYLYRDESGANLAQAEQAVESLAVKHGVHRYSRGFMVGIVGCLGLSLFAFAGVVQWLR